MRDYRNLNLQEGKLENFPFPLPEKRFLDTGLGIHGHSLKADCISRRLPDQPEAKFYFMDLVKLEFKDPGK